MNMTRIYKYVKIILIKKYISKFIKYKHDITRKKYKYDKNTRNRDITKTSMLYFTKQGLRCPKEEWKYECIGPGKHCKYTLIYLGVTKIEIETLEFP